MCYLLMEFIMSYFSLIKKVQNIAYFNKLFSHFPKKVYHQKSSTSKRISKVIVDLLVGYFFARLFLTHAFTTFSSADVKWKSITLSLLLH
jgi:hypothetical protein